ncbi:MAG: topoisomerase DNA-binding C4 zinc finger domain-containing protein, partial [Proteobacteria bacterium]|nr:topoisomerase DNA-binding C4 zinc finger domain-containing protein [Pseudomonadota bacterium]
LVKMAVPVATQKRGISSRSVIRLPEEGEAAKIQDSASTSAQAEKKADHPVPEVPVEAGTAVSPESSMEAAGAPESPAEPATEEAAQALVPEESGSVIGESAETVQSQSEDVGSAKEEEQEPLVLDEATVAEQVVSPELAAATEKMFAEAATSIEEPPPPAAGEGVSPVAVPDSAAKAGKSCPACGRVLLLKEDRFGKYWYCSGHPECRHSESYEKDGGAGLLCPVCRIGTVVTKHTPTGKIFYVCPEQDCEFMAWSKPHALACQVCDSPFLVEKKSLDGRVSLRCPKAGCTYARPVSGSGGAGQEAVGAPVKKKVLVRRVTPGGGGGGTKKVRIVRRKK